MIVIVVLQCKVSGFGIVGCVVYYEPHPSEMRLADIDGVTVYEDSTPERVAVVSAVVYS